MKKIFTFLFAALMSVGMYAEQATVVFAANSNTKEVTVELPHTFFCNFNSENGELDIIIKELYQMTYGGFCEYNEAPEATGNAAVNGGLTGDNQYIEISSAFEGTVTVTGTYNRYTEDPAIEDMPDSEVFQYILTISIKGAAAAKYYIVGDMTNWAVSADYEMTPSNVRVDEVEEYKYEITLTTANQFKVVKVEGENQTWFPDGMGNNYGEHGEIERDGDYTIYFRPNGDGDEDWFYGCIFAARHLVYENVVLGALLPENGKPANGVILVGTFSDEPMATEVIEETGGYIAIFEADGGDTFTFVDADDEDNYLVMRNAAGEWVPAVFTFEEEWEDDTWKGDPVKMIDMDLSDNSKYAWSTDIPEGLEEVLSEKAESRKVMIDGMLYIVRDGKMYNVQGVEVK